MLRLLDSLKNIILLTVLFYLSSCVNNPEKNLRTKSITPIKDDAGQYASILTSINPALTGEINGEISILIRDDEIKIEANLNSGSVGVRHLQGIMSSAKCPTSFDDYNRDGVVDATEALGIVGQILIPLDSDLNEQYQGINYGPISNDEGIYVYRKSAVFSSLLSDLYASDPDFDDYLTKLLNSESLNLDQRVILIHGISPDVELPETVSTFKSLRPNESLPIACGRISRLP